MLTKKNLARFSTQDEVDSAANALLVSLEDFSQYACVGGGLFGVKTFVESCDSTAGNCLREKIPSLLLYVQQEVEAIVGYNITPGYHIDHVRAIDGEILQLRSGIDGTGVSQRFSFIGSAIVSPFAPDSVQVVNGVATVPVIAVHDPVAVVFSDAEGFYRQYEDDNYPRRTETGWKLTARNAADGTYSVMDPTLFSVDYIHNGEYAIDNVVPIYPGTKQIIFEAAPRTVIDETTVRFWFHPWSLVDPAFAHHDIDLTTKSDLYKLFQSIDFGVFEDVFVDDLAVHLLSDSECAYSIEVIDARLGLVRFTLDNPMAVSNTSVFDFTLHYKTDPRNSCENKDLIAAKSAIIYRVAAELPIDSCGEANTPGFIRSAQTPYTSWGINPFTGEIFQKTSGKLPNNSYGHSQYALRMKDMAKISNIKRKYRVI